MTGRWRIEFDFMTSMASLIDASDFMVNGFGIIRVLIFMRLSFFNEYIIGKPNRHLTRECVYHSWREMSLFHRFRTPDFSPSTVWCLLQPGSNMNPRNITCMSRPGQDWHFRPLYLAQTWTYRNRLCYKKLLYANEQTGQLLLSNRYNRFTGIPAVVCVLK